MSDKNFKMLIIMVSASLLVAIGLYFYLTFKFVSDVRNDMFNMDDDSAMRFEEAMREMQEEIDKMDEEKELWDEEIEAELEEALKTLDSVDFSE